MQPNIDSEHQDTQKIKSENRQGEVTEPPLNNPLRPITMDGENADHAGPIIGRDRKPYGSPD